MPTSIELYSSIIRQSSVSEALPGTKVLPVTLFHPPFTYQDVKNRENSYSFGRSYKNFSKPAFRARRRRVWPKNQKSVPQPCYFAASAPSSFLRPHKETSHPRRMAGAFHQRRSSEIETMSLFANASIGISISVQSAANIFFIVHPPM